MRPDEAKHIILIDAADKANERLNEVDDLDSIEIFEPDPLSNSFSLILKESFMKSRPRPSDEILEQLHQIGFESIHQALLDNWQGFLGLIFGYAREGQDYFDTFDPDPQGRMF